MRRESAAEQIRKYLDEHGPVLDTSGRATSVLRDLVGFRGSEIAFAKALASLEESAVIERDIRGKRTYRIALGSGPRTPMVDAKPEPIRADAIAPSDGTDYDQLASQLLRQVVNVLSDTPRPDAARKVERLERDLTKLRRELAIARSEHRMAQAEREELERQLKNANHNLALLADRRDRRPDTAAKTLSFEEKALLNHLIRQPRGQSSVLPEE